MNGEFNENSEEIKLTKKLNLDRDFVPCAVSDGDELYLNGIFEFNITKMIEYIHEHLSEFATEEVCVKDLPIYSSIDDSRLESIKIGVPVILAEIAPGKYNLIDGNHRVAKAWKMAMKSISAYRLCADQHFKFLTEKKAYEAYVEYWNGKLREMGHD